MDGPSGVRRGGAGQRGARPELDEEELRECVDGEDEEEGEHAQVDESVREDRGGQRHLEHEVVALVVVVST